MATLLQTVNRPELQDDHLENSRKVPLDRHDIIIDKVRIFNYSYFVGQRVSIRVALKDVAKVLQKKC